MYKKILASISALIAFFSAPTFSQITTGQLTGQLADQVNIVETAVPFLTISPDSRAGGMGDVGAATTPDINSMYWNPAKYSFIEKKAGAAFSYTPWLRNLVGDIDLAYLSGYYRLAQKNVVACSFRYFSLGDIQFTNQEGVYQRSVKPNEFALDLGYSRLFGPKFSGAAAFRWIRSDLSQNATVQSIDTKPGQSIAVDIAAYYTDKVKISDYNGVMAWGINISNIGNKMSYTDETDKNFLPTNLRVGGSLTMNIDEYNSFMVTSDLNKLLVPTTPVYEDATATDKVILYGKDPNVGVVRGIFQSFSDAPGGYKEELHEIIYSVGSEYWYRKQFAVRAGYYHEHPTKGNRKYFTVGLGLKLNVFGIDFSYLVANNNNPLANTLRFSLSFEFADNKRVAGKKLE